MDSTGDVINKGNVMGYPSMNHNFPPPQHTPPGYSMTTAYQAGYVPPYQGYVFPPSSKNFGSHSFNMNYGAQNYGPWIPDSQNDNNVNKFGRLMLVTMTTMIITMCMVSMVVWSLFGTEVPEFHVSTFSVSNLNISSSMIQASWDVNVTVINPNPNLRVHSGPVQILIVYNNVPLLTSSVEPFSLEGNHQIDLNFKLENQKSPCKEVLAADMKMEEESGGTISFSVRLGLGAEFYTTTVLRRESLHVLCEDLKIIMGSSGNGTLAVDSPTECTIFT